MTPYPGHTTLRRVRSASDSTPHRRPGIRRLAVVFWMLLLVWGLVDVPRWAQLDEQDPTRHQTDLTVYTEAGTAFFSGRQPYTVSNLRAWTYVYPPLFAILLAPLHPPGWFLAAVASNLSEAPARRQVPRDLGTATLSLGHDRSGEQRGDA